MSYCTIEDLRSEGLDEEKYSDDKLQNLIKLSCEYIDRITGQFFEPREMLIRLDGRDWKNLVLPYFLIETEYVEVNRKVIDDYIIYNRMEDRSYPKIYRNAKWPKGILNIEIKGMWGYVEEDGSTPEPIKRIARKLAMYYFPALNDSEAQEEKNVKGLLISETTDGHSYEFANDAVSNLYASSITGDNEIDSVLKHYMRSKFRMAIV